MDLNSYSYRIFTTHQRRSRVPSIQRHPSAPGDERHAARWVVVAAWQAVVAVLRWVADLPWDSRERLRSKEQELARLGITWASDLVHDAALAREIEIARQRRRKATGLAPDGGVAVRQGSSLRAIRYRPNPEPPSRFST